MQQKRGSEIFLLHAKKSFLGKIKVPFDLLQRNVSKPSSEARVRLNIYCSEITHAMRVGEKSAVPTRHIRKGTEESGWSKNKSLRDACQDAKFWLRIWNEAERPRKGWLNAIRLSTKKKFARELTAHRANIRADYCAKIVDYPNLLWKTFKPVSKNTDEIKFTIPSSEWVQYFGSQFDSPDPLLENAFETKLETDLDHDPAKGDYIVTRDAIKQAIQKLKKKKSAGSDGICALHLVNGSEGLLDHLHLLFQMIFAQGIVPISFCVGMLTPLCKKGKPATQCSSYRPITVSPTLCKVMELLVIKEITEKCYMPDYQFGFRSGLGCAHALFALASILQEADRTKTSLALAGHDVERAFDSVVHPQALLELRTRGVQSGVIRVMKDMYANLRAKLKVVQCDKTCRNFSSLEFNLQLPEVRIFKGVRQGAITSPTLFDNAVLNAQSKTPCTFVDDGINCSVIAYADDILNLSRVTNGIESAFQSLVSEYAGIGLKFNKGKTEFLMFNNHSSEPTIINLIGCQVQSKSSLTYLGLPIGDSVKTTRKLLIAHLLKRISGA